MKQMMASMQLSMQYRYYQPIPAMGLGLFILPQNLSHPIQSPPSEAIKHNAAD